MTMASSESPATEGAQTPPEWAVVPEPFDNSTGCDIILRTSDQQSFHTYKTILSMLSPFFRSMFTLPKTLNDAESQEMPTIDLPEDAHTLYLLLTWLDPRCVPVSSSLKDIQTILSLAEKYDISIVPKKIEGSLSQAFIAQDPLRIYAVAIRYHMHSLARSAAKASLKIPLEDRRNIPEYQHIPASALQLLNEYYYTCRAAALSLTKDFTWMTPFASSNFRRTSGESHTCPYVPRQDGNWRKWFIDYMDLVTLRFHSQPCAETVHQVFAELESGCQYCSPTPRTLLRSWVGVFEREVEKVVGKVQLTIL